MLFGMRSRVGPEVHGGSIASAPAGAQVTNWVYIVGNMCVHVAASAISCLKID